jgi:hypothetical protein
VSSAILYLAIVAIWIGVLVPRWLRHDSSQTGPTGLRRFSLHLGSSRQDGDQERAGFDPEGRPRYTSFVPPAPEKHTPESHTESEIHHEEQVSPVISGNRESMAQLYEAEAPPAPVQSYGWSADEVAHQERLNRNRSRPGSPGSAKDASPVTPAPQVPMVGAAGAQEADDDRAAYYGGPDGNAERRAELVSGRRRMLWLLVALTAVGIGLTVLHLAAWWIVIPPMVLLGGYLLLLREAAQADAEASERREAARAAADQLPQTHPAEPDAAPAPAPLTGAYETGPRADIINLSEHVGDQLYDQYADAKLRAVGD